MRRALRAVHLWLGLTLGAVFVVLGLTGSILVFYTELDRLAHPALHVAASPPDWDRAVETLRARFPDKTGPWRIEVTPDPGPIPARYLNPVETQGRAFAPMMVWLSPDGRHILRRDYWGSYAATWIYDLHYQLLSGRPGRQLVGWIGLATLVLMAAGLALWWPRGSWAKAWRYKGDAGPLRRWRDQHKRAGLIGVLPLAVLSLTGSLLAWPDVTAALLRTSAGAAPAASARDAATGPTLRVGDIVRRAQQAMPDARIAWIEVPGTADRFFRLRVQVPGDPGRRFPHSHVWIDRASGQIVKVDDLRGAGAGYWVNAWLHPIHDGSSGGPVGRVLICLAGLLPALLYLTGIRRWRALRRRKVENGAA